MNWLLGLLLVAATFLAYQPAWHGGFIWDDLSHVEHNPLLFEPDGLKRIWFSMEAPQYYPLVFTSFRIERALWGVNPLGYHLVNLSLHSASALLLWLLLRRLNVRGAWLAAAVFALHPVNVESVAWITERKNTLSLFFLLLSLLFYLRFDQPPKAQSSKSELTSQPVSPSDTQHATRPTFHA
jgi:protein O-mannosyl-transferase